MDLAEIIRRKITAADAPSLTALAREARMDRGQLSRFASGQRDITLATASRLATALGLSLAVANDLTAKSSQAGEE